MELVINSIIYNNKQYYQLCIYTKQYPLWVCNENEKKLKKKIMHLFLSLIFLINSIDRVSYH